MLIKNKNQLISHYNDMQDNHTYFLINMQKCYHKAVYLDYSKKQSSLNRCKFCKAFPFQVIYKNQSQNKEKEQTHHNQSYKRHQRPFIKKQSYEQKQKNLFQCALCESISQKQIKLDLNSNQQKLQQSIYTDLDESGFLTSYLINFEPNQNNQQNPTKDLEQQFHYQLRLIFFLDLALSISVLEHFKNVILQVYQNFIDQNNESKPYRMTLFLLIDAKIFILQIEQEFKIICLQAFVSDKQSFTQILQKCIFECNYQNLQKFQEFMDVLIQQKCQGKYKGFSLDGGKYFSQILKSIKNDRSPLNYYITIWIGKIPPISYTQNSTGIYGSKNIFTSLFLFYQQLNKKKRQSSTNNSKNNNDNQQDLYEKNLFDAYEFNPSIKNQLQIISDNNQVCFLEDKEENIQFYYKFYKIFQIYSNIKLFNSKVQIKTDSKYAPQIVTRHHCMFYIKDNHYFLIKSDNNSSNKKYQISVQFDDIRQKKKLLLINWTTKNLKLMDRFVHIYACIQQTVKYVFSQFFLLKWKELNKKQTQGNHSIRTIDVNRLSIFLNDYMFKSMKNGQNQIIHDIYQFFLNNKRAPYYLLNFLSSYESFFSVYKIYPIVKEKIVYWVEGYTQQQKNALNKGQEQQQQQKAQLTSDQIVQRLNEYCQNFYCQKKQKISMYYDMQLKEQEKIFIYESQQNLQTQ